MRVEDLVRRRDELNPGKRVNRVEHAHRMRLVERLDGDVAHRVVLADEHRGDVAHESPCLGDGIRQARELTRAVTQSNANDQIVAVLSHERSRVARREWRVTASSNRSRYAGSDQRGSASARTQG